MQRTQPTIRLLLVDDHNLVRKGTRALLTQVDDIVVIAEAADGSAAIHLAAQLQPDVVLMDLMMPGVDGVTATAAIVAANPNARVIVLTSFGADDKLAAAVRAGALGYLLKDTDPDTLLQAIRQVARGDSWLTPDMARRVLAQYQEPPPATLVEPLTEREEEVLKRLAHGRSNSEIAAELSVAEVTVRTHVSHILAKLHCDNRVQAALYALRTGLVMLEGS